MNYVFDVLEDLEKGLSDLGERKRLRQTEMVKSGQFLRFYQGRFFLMFNNSQIRYLNILNRPL